MAEENLLRSAAGWRKESPFCPHSGFDVPSLSHGGTGSEICCPLQHPVTFLPPGALGDRRGAHLLLPTECLPLLGTDCSPSHGLAAPELGQLGLWKGETASVPCCPQPGGTGGPGLGRHRGPGQRPPVVSAASWGAGDGWEELTQPDEPSPLRSPTTKQSLQEVYNPALTLPGVMQEGSVSDERYPPSSASLCCRPALPGSEPEQRGAGGQHLSPQARRERSLREAGSG